jgi:hypothetical protein
MENAYNTMMSRNVDMDAIIAGAHGRVREGHSRQSSGAASVTLERSTPSPTLERRELRGRSNVLSRSAPREVSTRIESPSVSGRLGGDRLSENSLSPDFD